jgi:hypothetical protein
MHEINICYWGARLEKYLTMNYPFLSGWRSDILVRPGGKIGDIFSLVKDKFISIKIANFVQIR